MFNLKNIPTALIPKPWKKRYESQGLPKSQKRKAQKSILKKSNEVYSKEITTIPVNESAEGVPPMNVALEELLTVAAAIQQSRTPDFHEVSNKNSPEESETKRLIQNCFLCEKKVLGRNALGRHMKTAHPKVLGPYKCHFGNCDKTFETGYLLLQHVKV